MSNLILFQDKKVRREWDETVTNCHSLKLKTPENKPNLNWIEAL